MILSKFMGEVRGGSIPRGMVFKCRDRALADEYVAQIAKRLGLSVSPRDSVAAAVKDASRPNLFGGSEALFVVRDDAEFARDKANWKALSSVSSNYVAAIYDWDAVKAPMAEEFDAVEFPLMDKGVLANHVCAAVDIGPQRAEQLAASCGCQLGWAMLECDKVRQYAQAAECSEAEAYDALWPRGFLGAGVFDGRFQFINSFVLGNARETFGSAEASGGLDLINLLYMQLKSMYMVDCCSNSKNPVADTGLNWNQIKAYRYKKRKVKTRNIPKLLSALQAVESGVKMGNVPQDCAIRYFLVRNFHWVLY